MYHNSTATSPLLTSDKSYSTEFTAHITTRKGNIVCQGKDNPQRAALLKSAWNLFFKNGYEDTTVEDIISSIQDFTKVLFIIISKGKEGLCEYSLSYLFDQKYEELYGVIDPALVCLMTNCLFLNHELFYMIKTSVDIKLLAYLYSSQLITKDKKSLSDHKRFYFTWITEIIQNSFR